MSEDDWEQDDDSDVEQDNSIEDPENPELHDMSAAPNIPRLIQPIQRSKTQTEKGLMIVSVMETMRNKGNKKQYNRLCEYVFTRFFMLLE